MKPKDKYITAPEQIRLQKLILKVARSFFGEDFSTGGCTPFYSPRDWEERGEEYGTHSKLVVVHDGGDLAYFFDYNQEAYSYMLKMQKALEAAGYYSEACTCWYSAIYKR
jgi:hypothetical protein